MNQLRKCLFPMTLAAASLLIGCGSQQNKDRDFQTSGSREADQRAEQRMARDSQVRGEGTNDSKKKPVEEKKTLYQRLGEEKGITAIVDDFVNRAMADPRVNWKRKGVTRGGLSINRNKTVEWDATDANVAQLKKHMVQFFSVATGGDTHYDGQEMKPAHADLHISNAEFDATIGDLKVTLDKFELPNDVQKEVLMVVESTRPQIVAER